MFPWMRLTIWSTVRYVAFFGKYNAEICIYFLNSHKIKWHHGGSQEYTERNFFSLKEICSTVAFWLRVLSILLTKQFSSYLFCVKFWSYFPNNSPFFLVVIIYFAFSSVIHSTVLCTGNMLVETKHNKSRFMFSCIIYSGGGKVLGRIYKQ